MPQSFDFYDLLDLPRDATQEEIRQAYRDAARRLHPDARDTPGQTEFFLQVQEAYETLSEPKKRQNYDQRLEREVDKRQPISIRVTYSRPKLPILDEPQLIYALFELSPQLTGEKSNPPVNACLIIDRSTSMQGERMDTVKTAAIEISRQLRSGDLLSIVAFSDRAEVMVQASRSKNLNLVETQIRMMRAGGGTEIFQGLSAGYSELKRHLKESAINHIFLLTDGRTYGDEDNCLNLADIAARDGVRITGLGIGSEWNDDLLDEMAARTGGSSFYISKTSDIQKFLKEKFNTLGSLYAEQVLLSLGNGSNADLNSAFRLQPDSSELITESPVRLGIIPNKSILSVLLEFIVPPIQEGRTRLKLLTGELSFIIPSESRVPQKYPIRLSRLVGEIPDHDFPPQSIFRALSQITLYRMQERARQEVAEGKSSDASQRLKRLATQLNSMGEMKLAETALGEAERIQKTHMISAEGEKQIKYGTRFFLLPDETGD
jgi:Ca-activated chloride channel family protein